MTRVLPFFRVPKRLLPLLAGLHQLLFHVDHFVLEVHAVPGQADQLADSHPGEGGRQEQRLEGIALQRFKQFFLFRCVQRHHRLLHHLGTDGVGGRVLRQILHPHGHVQRPVQDAVDVLDVLGAHSIVPHLVVELLDHGRPQILEQYVTEGRLQVQPHHGFVLERRVGLYVRQVLLQPGVQPLPHGDNILRLGLGRLLGSGRRFGRLPSVDAQQRFHLLPALLLSAGVDALADQLARLGIGAQGPPRCHCFFFSDFLRR